MLYRKLVPFTKFVESPEKYLVTLKEAVTNISDATVTYVKQKVAMEMDADEGCDVQSDADDGCDIQSYGDVLADVQNDGDVLADKHRSSDEGYGSGESIHGDNDQPITSVAVHVVKNVPQQNTEPKDYYICKPPKYRGENPELFLLSFDIASTANNWSKVDKLKYLPSSFPPSLMAWYYHLANEVKSDYDLLINAFKLRFKLTTDILGLEYKYHRLKASAFTSLSKFASAIESLSLKLNKTPEQNLSRFMLGLTDGMYRWVVNHTPQFIEGALRHALNYESIINYRNQESNQVDQHQDY